MFGLSGEHLIILTVIFLFFGPRYLPSLGGVLGKTARNFRNSLGGEREAQFKKIREHDAD